ncbi:hypothetical protein, partial [Mycobacterium sp.]|uniref:hypothetical protein n=1 Tax=Mycobacterium sp. TaxID=1785 RepID=UPI003C72D5F7
GRRLMSTLAFVPEETDSPENEDAQAADDRRPVFSGLGIASAVLGLLCVAAIVLTSIIWSTHRDERDELDHQSRAMQVALNWAGVLINMNKDNIEASVQKLHEGTVGTLNTDLDQVIEPLTNLVKTLQLRTTGQVNAVAIESVHRDPNREPGSAPPDETVGGLASRTDTVLIIATLTAENAGGKRPPSSLNLRIGVSDVDGQLLVSGLDLLR